MLIESETTASNVIGYLCVKFVPKVSRFEDQHMAQNSSFFGGLVKHSIVLVCTNIYLCYVCVGNVRLQIFCTHLCKWFLHTIIHPLALGAMQKK